QPPGEPVSAQDHRVLGIGCAVDGADFAVAQLEVQVTASARVKERFSAGGGGSEFHGRRTEAAHDLGIVHAFLDTRGILIGDGRGRRRRRRRREDQRGGGVRSGGAGGAGARGWSRGGGACAGGGVGQRLERGRRGRGSVDLAELIRGDLAQTPARRGHAGNRGRAQAVFHNCLSGQSRGQGQ